jgi:hypothetical protein
VGHIKANCPVAPTARKQLPKPPSDGRWKKKFEHERKTAGAFAAIIRNNTERPRKSTGSNESTTITKAYNEYEDSDVSESEGSA